MRRYHRVKRRASLKPSTYTEGDVVDKEGISGKVGVHYPGRSVSLPCATFVVRRREELTEVSLSPLLSNILLDDLDKEL